MRRDRARPAASRLDPVPLRRAICDDWTAAPESNCGTIESRRSRHARRAVSARRGGRSPAGPRLFPPLLRDLLDDLARAGVVAVARDVGLRDDADEPAVLLHD